MNLQPLYDVKARLEQAAIAGTGLLAEDFRLARAAGALHPLAAASPVFARIETELAALPGAPAEERGGRLLDLLALVDAVACTQARTGAEGALTPLRAGQGVFLPLSFSQLQPLLSALTSTGGGRLETVQAAWENHPEFFRDYRVLPALVAGLGDTYGEMADRLAQILIHVGPDALALLKRDFDPAGKKDMVRRVQVIDAVAGEAENDWYLAQLPASRRAVRQALIFALRHSAANAPLLIRLCETEKADALTAARLALARLEAPEARAYLEALGGKDRAGALDILKAAATPTADALTTAWFLEAMDGLQNAPASVLTEEQFHLLNRLRTGLTGRAGADVQAVFSRAAAAGTALDRDCCFEKDGKSRREPMLFYCMGATNTPESRRPFSAAMPVSLTRSIQFTRDAGLCALAGKLAEQYGGPWIAPALCAALLTQDSAAAGRRMTELLYPKFRLFSGRAAVDRRAALRDALWGLYWDGRRGRYAYMIRDIDPADALRPGQRQPAYPALPGMLDPAWFGALVEAGGLDTQLIGLVPDGRQPGLAKTAKYLYTQALRCTEKNACTAYVRALVRCGWQDWDKFWVRCALRQGEVWFYSIRNDLNLLPVSGHEKAEQLKVIMTLVRLKKLKARGGVWPEDRLEQMISEWEAEAPRKEEGEPS